MIGFVTQCYIRREVITWGCRRFTNIENNATLVAMLAYLASEDERVSRDQRAIPVDRLTGEPTEWPTCEDGARQTTEEYR